MNVTYVPDLDKADGQLGTGSNLVPIPESNVLITYVPNPNAADGQSILPVFLASISALDYIDYPGPPNLIPPALSHIVVDSNGQQWMYYSGGWN